MKIDFDHLQQNRPEDAEFQRIELGQHRDRRLREHLDRMRCANMASSQAPSAATGGGREIATGRLIALTAVSAGVESRRVHT